MTDTNAKSGNIGNLGGGGVTAQGRQSADSHNDSSKAEQLQLLKSEVSQCSLCSELVANRTQPVFGNGNPNAAIVFIGQAPAENEDREGTPFIGPSGDLLNELLDKANIKRSDVFVCNVIKCRPPKGLKTNKDREPTSEEINNCKPFLERTLAIIQPKMICCLGEYAAQTLLQSDQEIGKLRGKVHEYKGTNVICTYHPSYYFQTHGNPAVKQAIENDLNELVRLVKGK